MQSLLIGRAVNDSVLAPLAQAAPGHVLTWSVDPAHYASEHERRTRRSHAQRLAALKGYRFFGEVGDAAAPPEGPLYFVPSDTLVGCEFARSMGIAGEGDLFGGVVPFAYVATKAISHPLHGEAAGPEGWVAGFAPGVRHCVLDGYSAYSESDARRAGRWLLRTGSVRVKPVRATGGRGQRVARDAAMLDRQLAELPDIAGDGVVLERNLRKPRTLSVGQVTVGSLRVSYYGLQRLTRNHQGKLVYGGSDLCALRGDLDTLHGLPLAPELRLAIDQARAYHAAVVQFFPGFLASRINYDVAQGFDDAGAWCSGVLEQSWRVGGATGAELSAMEALHAQPDRPLVRASCFEVFGEASLPPGACVYFDGIDPSVGRLVKYSFAEPHADPT